MTENENQHKSTEIQKIEAMNLEETQLAEQLYSNAGLGPVVDAGLKDYDKNIQREDKLITKVLGPRGSDIKGYGEAVAKRVSLAVYFLLNRQYGGKMGDLKSHIMALQDERDRANTRYDELMGRVVGILGEEYKQLRTDSNQFMQKLTEVLGEDLKESKIDQKALAESLADIDGLRLQIKKSNEEQQKLKDNHQAKVNDLNAIIKELNAENESVKRELAKSKKEYQALKKAIEKIASPAGDEKATESVSKELYDFLLTDSKVPKMVIDGVNKFIDLRKYLGAASEKGAESIRQELGKTLNES
jgi:methyl-accepting chemotaxis protein